MPPFNPIGDAGRTLRSLLLEEMSTWGVGEEQVALTSPEGFEPEEAGLSIHLYRLVENEHLSNRPPTTGDHTADASLVLELSYLVTAHPPSGETVDTTETLEQHRLLSKAIRTLKEYAVVRPPNLLGALADGPPIHVTMDAADDARVMDVWGTFNDTPYLPSISYRVTPVVIEAEPPEPAPRVVETTMEYLEGSKTGDHDGGSDDRATEQP